jgi:hypothetical protein
MAVLQPGIRQTTLTTKSPIDDLLKQSSCEHGTFCTSTDFPNMVYSCSSGSLQTSHTSPSCTQMDKYNEAKCWTPLMINSQLHSVKDFFLLKYFIISLWLLLYLTELSPEHLICWLDEVRPNHVTRTWQSPPYHSQFNFLQQRSKLPAFENHGKILVDTSNSKLSLKLRQARSRFNTLWGSQTKHWMVVGKTIIPCSYSAPNLTTKKSHSQDPRSCAFNGSQMLQNTRMSVCFWKETFLEL